MRRKLVLLLGTFCLLLLAFGTYRLFMPQAIGGPEGGARRRVNWGESGAEPGLGVATKAEFFDRNRDGKLRGIYRVDAWDKENDGSFTFIRPKAELRQSDGSRTYMTAETGRVWAEEVADGFNVKNGRMDGEVVIYVDQSKDVRRDHPAVRKLANRAEFDQNVMEIHTRDICFDRSALTIQSDGDITLWSKEMDISGKGLTVQWNESPRELRLLRIETVYVMTIKNLPERMDMIQLPRKNDSAGAKLRSWPRQLAFLAPEASSELEAPAGVEERKTPDAEKKDEWGLDKGETPQASDSDDKASPALPAEDRGEPAPPADEKKTGPKVKVSRETGTPPVIVPIRRPTPTERNIYRAAFTRNVRVFSGDRRLEGADELALVFEWDRARGGEKKEQPASPSSVRPSDETPPAAAEDPPASPEPASPAPASAGERMQIYCDGPLEIVPTGTTPRPSRKRYTLIGKGRRVVLRDEEVRVICRTFRFENPQEEATFCGDKDAPVRLELSRGEEIICRDEIRFNRSKGEATLKGAGTLNRYEQTEPDLPWGGLGPDEKDTRTILEQIYWADRLLCAFVERQVHDETGKVVRDAAGKPLRRTFIREADFHKDVRLVQLTQPAPEKPGRARAEQAQYDYVLCDRMKVDMGVSPQGESNPTRALAEGHVRAQQGPSSIRADKVAVHFRPRPKADDKKKTDTPGPLGATSSGPLDLSGGRVEVTRVQASGGVRIEDYSDPEADRFIAAETIDRDMIAQTASLTGAPAKIWQGPNRIEGQKIYFEERTADRAELAQVDGVGYLEFFTRQSFSGRTLSRPRHVRIDWEKQMRFDGKENVCTFDKQVILLSGARKDPKTGRRVLVRGGAMMACDRMSLSFSPPAEEDASGPTGEKTSQADRSLGVGMAKYSKRDIQKIEAVGRKDKNGKISEDNMVLMRSRRQDMANPLLLERRMELRGRKVNYDAATGDTFVDGAGRFSSEDYRPPDKNAGGEPDSPIGGRLERPSQTVVTWKESLALSQQNRHIAVRQDVRMFHRSGDKLYRMPGLRTVPAGDLKTGRNSQLRCEQLDAWFAEPPEPKTDSSAKPEQRDLLDAGPNMGPLKMFKAVRDVSMKDGDVTIDGQRLDYDGLKKLVIVRGFLPNDSPPHANARITREDKDPGQVQTFESPQVLWDMKNDRIEAKEITGAGGG